MVRKASTAPLETAPSYENMDPRLLKKFLRMQEFRESLTPEQYSSARFRISTARWQPEERIVWKAVEEGYSDTESLPVATGLTTEQIERALGRLVTRGALRITKVTV